MPLTFSANLCLALITTTPLDTVKQEQAAQELAKLQGVWKCIANERQGVEVKIPAERVVQDTLVIVGDQYTLRDHAGRFDIDPSKRPSTINLIVKCGRHKGSTVLGIWERSGDTLRVTIPSSLRQTQARPTVLQTDERSRSTLYTFERDATITTDMAATTLKKRKDLLEAGSSRTEKTSEFHIGKKAADVKLEQLETILNRLDQIDKRLERLERKAK